ncbi:hypothetical protein OPAG_02958 [Rhodococcus opacus PD630]|uniref:DUF5947 family protein n=1 Tax=Rhodococcus TaxID=1827 RepID=UPI00029CC3F1|nr:MULTISPECIES: DUF5947 family protein [Rhodococcus]KXF54308.1 hypothetical protein AXA44_06830 [Rhodococcus sp. SC4]RZK71650.1 MAG: hypothetical protein EOP25_04440 [Rhodococcus sp. (in: high G+C Gram-positive bacteria)]AHK28317.1 hypothetical protein Pd630_LPD01083 [Rhodococcus opacus PD630]EHI44616.1 hypothetical protein OPAG_02958 [Rhodococcus opacus PD630]KXX61188.1 hypothetical protein AZG88_04895 [Rhodococcus sp. LB1]
MSPSGNGLRILQRIASERPKPVVGERCDMCAVPIADAHQHVVNVQDRQLMCVCRGCYLLFTDESAELRFRAVPERYLSFPDFELAPGRWDELEIPVGLAFVFRNSLLAKTVAFYPGPAGATESELPLDAWDGVLAANPALGRLSADTEALLLRVPEHGGADPECYLVPIDACYQLVGELRQVWRGFDGGQDARRVIDTFFETVRARSRVAKEPT